MKKTILLLLIIISGLNIQSQCAWQPIGTNQVNLPSLYNEPAKVCINSSNDPIVVFNNTLANTGHAAKIVKYNAGTWQDLNFNSFLASTTVNFTAVKASRVTEQITTSYFAANQFWISIKENQFSNWLDYSIIGGYQYGDADMDKNDTIFTCYKDANNLNKLSVKKYFVISHNISQISSWPSLSAGQADFCQMAIDTNNIPYVAYKDIANGGGITVQKYTGSWQVVGTVAFTPGTDYQINSLDLVINNLNQPTIVYTNPSFPNNKIRIYEFDGTIWSPVNLGLTYDAWFPFCELKCNKNGDYCLSAKANVGTPLIDYRTILFRKNGVKSTVWTQSQVNDYGMGIAITDTVAYSIGGTEAYRIPFIYSGSSYSVNPTAQSLKTIASISSSIKNKNFIYNEFKDEIWNVDFIQGANNYIFSKLAGNSWVPTYTFTPSMAATGLYEQYLAKYSNTGILYLAYAERQSVGGNVQYSMVKLDTISNNFGYIGSQLFTNAAIVNSSFDFNVYSSSIDFGYIQASNSYFRAITNSGSGWTLNNMLSLDMGNNPFTANNLEFGHTNFYAFGDNSSVTIMPPTNAYFATDYNSRYALTNKDNLTTGVGALFYKKNNAILEVQGGNSTGIIGANSTLPDGTVGDIVRSPNDNLYICFINNSTGKIEVRKHDPTFDIWFSIGSSTLPFATYNSEIKLIVDRNEVLYLFYNTGNQNWALKFSNILVTTQPANMMACVGSSVSFNTVLSNGFSTLQWQMDIGNGFQNLTNSGTFSGVTSQTLVINSIPYSLTANALGGYIPKFRLLISSGCGNGYTNTVELASFNASASINIDNSYCSGGFVQLSASNPAAGYSTNWQPGNLTGNIITVNVTQPITYTASIPSLITYNTNTIVCYPTTTIQLINTTSSFTPSICEVTVDSLSNYNEIYWKKTLYPQADSFIVYRETTIGNFTRIGGRSKADSSIFIDTLRHFPSGINNGNPNVASWKYKIKLVDTCGNYSSFSPYHSTIFVQDQQNGNFNWNPYAIEGTTVTPVTGYDLVRRDVATGTETIALTVTIPNTFDPLYNSLWNTGIKWHVDATGFNCDPTAKVAAQKVKTKSNHANEKVIATKIENLNSSINNSILLYPNPAKDKLTIETGVINEALSIELNNLLGQTLTKINVAEKINTINISNYISGIYFLTIKLNNKTVSVKKVVIE